MIIFQIRKIKTNLYHYGIVTEKDKLLFISGYIDGDGCCNFNIGVNSIQLYGKNVDFILKPFEEFLSEYGYVSRSGYSMYISPIVSKHLKKFIIKKDIRKKYKGSVNTKKAFRMLKSGISMYKISKIMGFSKKTVILALRQTYGKDELKKYFRINKRPIR